MGGNWWGIGENAVLNQIMFPEILSLQERLPWRWNNMQVG